MRFFILFFVLTSALKAPAQKVDNIFFNLYTDSLKKGFYNYISVDGKLADGTWTPLDSTQVRFSANTGYFKGNAIFIDSSYTGETITVKAMLRSNPAIVKEVTIYIRKRGFTEPLKTNDEIRNDMRGRPRRGRLPLA